jgi:gamma-glutamyltranspeptidase/glutathione hydrolase
MRLRSGAVSNDPVAARAARDLLTAGASAVGAVLGGFFAAAGAHAGVLLGPLTVLVGGIGVGARAFDGRLCQPGLGARRPRGLTASDKVPDEARIAVPTSVPAAAVALAYQGGQSLATIVKPGIALAERGGAEARASVLKRVRASGAAAFGEQSFVRALLRAAGPSQGGLLSPADFHPPSEIDREAVTRGHGSGKLIEAPWAADPAGAETAHLGAGGAVCAIDVRGVFAAVAFRRFIDGFPIEELELDAPLLGVPVLRGVARVAPGTRLPAPAPVAIRTDTGGVPIEVIASPAAARLTGADLEKPALCLRRSAKTQEVEIVAG